MRGREKLSQFVAKKVFEMASPTSVVVVVDVVVVVADVVVGVVVVGVVADVVLCRRSRANSKRLLFYDAKFLFRGCCFEKQALFTRGRKLLPLIR